MTRSLAAEASRSVEAPGSQVAARVAAESPDEEPLPIRQRAATMTVTTISHLPLLKGNENYTTWQHAIEGWCLQNFVWDIIHKDKPGFDDTKEDKLLKREWERSDQQLQGIFLQVCETGPLSCIPRSEFDTAKKQYDRLREVFQGSLYVIRTIHLNSILKASLSNSRLCKNTDNIL